jgi:hypothetical protein
MQKIDYPDREIRHFVVQTSNLRQFSSLSVRPTWKSAYGCQKKKGKDELQLTRQAGHPIPILAKGNLTQ